MMMMMLMYTIGIVFVLGIVNAHACVGRDMLTDVQAAFLPAMQMKTRA